MVMVMQTPNVVRARREIAAAAVSSLRGTPPQGTASTEDPYGSRHGRAVHNPGGQMGFRELIRYRMICGKSCPGVHKAVPCVTKGT